MFTINTTMRNKGIPHLVYRASLHLYPKAYRLEYGEQMVQTLQDMLDNTETATGRVGVWLRVIVETPLIVSFAGRRPKAAGQCSVGPTSGIRMHVDCETAMQTYTKLGQSAADKTSVLKSVQIVTNALKSQGYQGVVRTA